MSVPITPRGTGPEAAAQATQQTQELAAAKRAALRPQQDKTQAAARQFEGLLLQQVLKALWETSPGLSGPSSGMYQQMFQGPLADHLARAGGIGLTPMLERAMRHAPNPPAAGVSAPASHAAALGPATPNPAAIASSPETPNIAAASTNIAPADSALARIQTAATSLLDRGGERWGKSGALEAADLMPDPAALGGSSAHSSIRDARGYQGYYKCNLFALEMARRAGFAVPVLGQDGNHAYPLSNDITRDAADGQLSAGWARVVTGTPAAQLDASLQSGERALMLSGAGLGERHGHMAVVERVRKIEYGPEGQVRRVVFDGWEARPDGARHLRERTWNLHGQEGGHDARNGFQRIEILELRRAEPDLASAGGSASTADRNQNSDSASSRTQGRPIQSSEED